MASPSTDVRTPPTGRVLTWALLTVVVALVAGAVVGVLTAVVMLQLSSDAATNGWADLAAVVVGVLVGAVTAVVTWAIGLVIGARRYFPPGSRAVPVLLTMGTTAIGSAAVVALVRAAGGGGDALGFEHHALAVLAVVAFASAVFPWWERRLARRG